MSRLRLRKEETNKNIPFDSLYNFLIEHKLEKCYDTLKQEGFDINKLKEMDINNIDILFNKINDFGPLNKNRLKNAIKILQNTNKSPKNESIFSKIKGQIKLKQEMIQKINNIKTSYLIYLSFIFRLIFIY